MIYARVGMIFFFLGGKKGILNGETKTHLISIKPSSVCSKGLFRGPISARWLICLKRFFASFRGRKAAERSEEPIGSDIVILELNRRR